MVHHQCVGCIEQPPPRGVTLIEVVVALGLVAILVALLLPAIQSARAASRRVRCASNLRQLGQALNAYVADYTVYPPWLLFGPSKAPVGPWNYNVVLLPYLEQTGLYNSINLSIFWQAAENRTVMGTSLECFLCPSDFAPNAGPRGFSSYPGCRGSGVHPKGGGGLEAIYPADGFFCVKGADFPLGPADAPDGLSNTAALSERIHGARYAADYYSPTGGATVHPKLGFIYDFASLEPPTQKHMLELCRSAEGIRRTIGMGNTSAALAGEGWLGGTFAGYTHLTPPNSFSCSVGSMGDAYGSLAASSNHPNGVHLLYADGHVQFVEETVDLGTWRALGSRNGREAVSDF